MSKTKSKKKSKQSCKCIFRQVLSHKKLHRRSETSALDLNQTVAHIQSAQLNFPSSISVNFTNFSMRKYANLFLASKT